MASNTGYYGSSDTNTRAKVMEDQLTKSDQLAVMTSLPICSCSSGISAKGTSHRDLVCGRAVCDKQCDSMIGGQPGKVFCSCEVLGVPDYRHQRNSVGVICARQKRSNYQRSLSLPGSRKGLYDTVVSDDLLCLTGHIYDASLKTQLKTTQGGAEKRGYRKPPVKQSVSYQDRDLVKMEIELELANSVPQEFQNPKTEGVRVKNRERYLDAKPNAKMSRLSKKVPEGVGHNGSTQEGGSTGSTPTSETSEWSLDFTPNVLYEDVHNRKRVGRSHSWTFSTNFMDLDSDSSSSQESINSVRYYKGKKTPNGAVGGGDNKGVARTRRRCRNVHATLSLNEQEIQALEEHLEQNVYVPVQLLIGSRGSRRRPPNEFPRPLFVLAEIVTDECCVCLSTTLVRQRDCCSAFVCDSCFKMYLNTMVNQRLVTMQCPSFECKKYLSREEIAYHLDHASRDKFYRFILEANGEPHMKTCPRCNFVKMIDKELLAKKTLSPLESKVVCEQCDLDWCFPCHAPWHDDLTCKEFWKGDRLLKDWAKERHLGIVNAHKCPKCRVFIQRSSGCDHMTCSRCGTEFCYQCGGRFRGIRYFGNHYSRYSIFGCKYRYKPEDPVERKVIRGAIFGARVLATPFCAGLVVAAGCVIAPIALVTAVSFLGVRSAKQHRENRKWRKRRARIEREDRELGDPSVFKRYSTRNVYHAGEVELEVSYP